MDSERRHWSMHRLGDLVDVFDGPHATPPKVDAGPVFLGISSLVNGRLDLAASEHIPETHFAQWTRRVVPQENDLVFSYETRIGQAALIPAGLRCCLGRRMGLLRVRDTSVDPRFLLYAYLAPEFQETLRQRTVHGSTVDRILLQELPEFPIRIPDSIGEQRAIAAVLGALDDKIDLNRRMNRTLERIAATLFRAWFVDFEPVRAKAEGRAPVGIDAATAALFPDRLVASEIGEIPEGWSIAPLDVVADFVNGLAMQKYPEGAGPSLPVIKIAQLRRGSPEGADRASMDVPEKYVVEDGDLLFSWSGSLEIRFWTGGRGALNQHLFKVTSDEFPAWFIHQWLLFHLPAFRSIAQDKATTMGHIQRRHLTEAKVVMPALEVLESAHTVFDPLLNRVIGNDLQNRTLAALRDLLLPRLLSGEVRVPVAEAAVAEAM